MKQAFMKTYRINTSLILSSMHILKNLQRAFLFLFILSFNFTYAQHDREIDALFTSYNTSESPGLAVSVVKDGNVIYQKGFGMANLEYGVPITEKTKFHVASLSKQFTAFLILKLEDDGLLSIEDDVRKYIPELPDYGKTITLNHLLTHSSGIREQWRLLEMAGWRLDDVIKTEQIFKLLIKQKELNFSPGDRFMYSNSGYTLLAIIIERLTKKSFADYARQIIFDPLQMNNSFFYDDHEELVTNRAYSYQKVDEQLKKSNLNFATVGPTSLFTTVEDMNKWALNFRNITIGNKDIFKSLKQKARKNDGSISSYAKGQFVRKYRGFNMIYHSGSDAGYRCYYARFPKLGYQFILLANASYISAYKEIFKLIDFYLKDQYPKKKSTASEAKIFQYKKDIFVNLSGAEMKKFEGTYYNRETQDYIKVKLENDTLYGKGDVLSEAQKLHPVGDSSFKIVGTSYDISVNFKENDFQEPILEFRIPNEMWLWLVKVEQGDPSIYKGSYYSDELHTEYEVVEKDKELYLTHHQLDDIKITQIKASYFGSTNRNFSTIRFSQSESGEIMGFSVSNGGIKNLIFSKK